jgi:hypothetical protein
MNRKIKVTKTAALKSPADAEELDAEGAQGHLFFDEARQRPHTKAHDGELSKMLRNQTIALDLEGKPMDFNKPTEEIIKHIEHLDPLIRPYGCGPVAPANWLVLRTYQKIIELRDEIRCDEFGLVVGDRTMKRCYQQAMRDIKRYEAASPALRVQADAAGTKGVPAPPVLGESVGRIRSPVAAVENAFAYIMDKHWHRYVLPFGCYFIHKPTTESRGWTEWKTYMATSARCNTNNLLINPCAVTAADVLYLCNTVGYMKRFTFVVGIIIWAMQKGVNILRHTRRHTDSHYRLYMTLEKLLHLFGSIYMHRKVLESNDNVVAGNWTDTINLLVELEKQCYSMFNLKPHSLTYYLDNMVVETIRGSPSALVNVFPKTSKITDKGK